MAGLISGIIGAGLQIGGAIGGNSAASKTVKKLDRIGKLDPAYTGSNYAAANLGLASNLFNGRMAGAGALENNIYATQANTVGNINRNATDGSQALALASGAQGQANAGFNQLALAEAQNKQQNFQNLTNAQQGMTEEHTKLFDDKVRRWQDQMGIAMKQNQMKQQQWSNAANLGSSIFGMGDFWKQGQKPGPNPYSGQGGWD